MYGLQVCRHFCATSFHGLTAETYSQSTKTVDSINEQHSISVALEMLADLGMPLEWREVAVVVSAGIVPIETESVQMACTRFGKSQT